MIDEWAFTPQELQIVNCYNWTGHLFAYEYSQKDFKSVGKIVISKRVSSHLFQILTRRDGPNFMEDIYRCVESCGVNS